MQTLSKEPAAAAPEHALWADYSDKPVGHCCRARTDLFAVQFLLAAHKV